jgi:aspartyl-tRNA(Asn)/glutamyl-tRNA(Gln) amidotransferase subunit A
VDPTTATATAIADAVRTGSVTARAVTDACLERVGRHDATIGAFLLVDAEGARARADAVDERVRRGEDPGPLAGVPVALKDNLCVRGQATTCASRVLEQFRPPYDAHVVERLREAGAVFLGKTNLDEFAMGSSTENSALRVTRNPRDPDRAPGGSSGGSAAAVAAGFAPLALGSDTGGSIRLPASFCGCVGMKPTYGLVSRYGLVAYGSSLDQIGPFARTVGDAALLLNAIAGPDLRDATCRAAEAPDHAAELAAGVEGLRIGVVREHLEAEGLDDAVRAAVTNAVDALREAGATIVDVHLPTTTYAIPTYYIIAMAEASSNLARYDGVHYGHRASGADDIISLFSQSREAAFGEEVKRRIMLGTYVLSAGYYDAYYLRALRVRTRIAADVARALSEADVLLGPVSPCTAFPLGERMADPLAMYLSDIYTISANLAAVPAISVPCGADASGLPIGLQIMGPRFGDARVLRVAAAWERLAPEPLPAVAPL